MESPGRARRSGRAVCCGPGDPARQFSEDCGSGVNPERLKDVMKTGDVNTYFRTVCYIQVAGKKGNGECDVFFKDGKPQAVIHNYGKMLETVFLDPALLRPSPSPDYDLVYLGTICLDDPKQQ